MFLMIGAPLVLDTTLYDIFVSDGLVFSSVSSTNKTDCHGITTILLKVEVNTLTPDLFENCCRQNLERDTSWGCLQYGFEQCVWVVYSIQGYKCSSAEGVFVWFFCRICGSIYEVEIVWFLCWYDGECQYMGLGLWCLKPLPIIFHQYMELQLSLLFCRMWCQFFAVCAVMVVRPDSTTYVSDTAHVVIVVAGVFGSSLLDLFSRECTKCVCSFVFGSQTVLQ